MSTLYIVATPIGNLDDFSQRAVDVLKSADKIACEDTRTSSVLLHRYSVDKPLFSFHQHNEHKKVSHIMNLLSANETVAIISDAGMPGISDPGFLAVRAAHQNGHDVCVIPGPDACTTALVASGLPCDRYLFEGFLPPKKGRQTRIRQIAESEVTVVCYESPHKLPGFLEDLRKYCDETRLVCIARELTKKFEQVQRGELGPLTRYWTKNKPKGEFVIVISGRGYSE